jgi:hypothetical protein
VIEDIDRQSEAYPKDRDVLELHIWRSSTFLVLPDDLSLLRIDVSTVKTSWYGTVFIYALKLKQSPIRRVTQVVAARISTFLFSHAAKHQAEAGNCCLAA